MAAEFIDTARERLTDQLEKGVQSSAKDDMRLENYDPAKALDVIERLERKEITDVTATKPHFGIRMTKLVPPGCG